MQYHYRHQRWQLYVFNPLKNTLVSFFESRFIFTLNYSTVSQLYFLISKRLSKALLALVPLILLPYSANIQALSASIAHAINGTKPYLTSDNGHTKVSTTEGLLGITLSDGTSITPRTNTSTSTNPIKLPKDGQSFADIGMLIPTTTDSITLNDLIAAPYNYWGDDDGDGQGVNGITATGSLSVSITDKNNQTVSRSTVLNICYAPYKVVLTSTNGHLTTQYGEPNSTSFTSSSATYYLSPKTAPAICYAKPELSLGTDSYAGPDNIWSSTKGFLLQSSSDYSFNFPTTGANNLYFDLNIMGSGTLRWPAVTMAGITATMTPNNNGTSVRVKLTGPAATADQIQADTPGSISKPILPQTFELVGYDSSDRAVVKYGFVLKQWFVNRGDKRDTPQNHASWCTNLGYRQIEVSDVTNASGEGYVGSSSGNYYQRKIGAGLFSEWGSMINYIGTGFSNIHYYWTNSYASEITKFAVNSDDGNIGTNYFNHNNYGICTSP
jgi:hypothetical protein